VLLGWLHGIGTWLVAMSWIVPTLVTYGELPRPLAWILMLLLAGWLGSFHALAAWLISRGGARRAWVAAPSAAAAWVAVEWLRGWSFSGFPWNLAAYAALDTPGALAASAWLGPWGVSFLVALVGAGIADAIRRRSWQIGATVVLVPLVLLPLAGRWVVAQPVEESPGPPLEVRVIQPNIPNLVGWDPARVEQHYQQLWRQTFAACERPGMLLVWPESAAWPYRVGVDPRLDGDISALQARGCSLLVNSATEEQGRWYNSVWRLAPDEGPVRADKRHLVPFGEYVPFGELLPFVGRLARNAGDFSPAGSITLLPVGQERLGVAVCYEIVFPGEVAALVDAGASVLVTVTNDAWYGDTAAPWQHLAAARFRAAELRRPLLRAAITGVSAVIDPHGRVLRQAGVGEQATLPISLWGRLEKTPAARWPWLGPALMMALTVAGWFAARR
jgi:apolipoprotein N-acyltransferase